MNIPGVPFEVEIRFRFDSYGEALKEIPFLHLCLHDDATWISTIYGLELFRSGQLLRIGDVFFYEEEKYYLSWKGPDIGEFANIRQELDEDITTGINNSVILERLKGRTTITTSDEAAQELERLGHHRFMSFRGRDRSGYYEPSNIDVKLMYCPMLRYPIIVEIEKIAGTEEESKKYENELYELSHELKLQDRMVKEEPPTLLYQAIFGE